MNALSLRYAARAPGAIRALTTSTRVGGPPTAYPRSRNRRRSRRSALARVARRDGPSSREAGAVPIDQAVSAASGQPQSSSAANDALADSVEVEQRDHGQPATTGLGLRGGGDRCDLRGRSSAQRRGERRRDLADQGPGVERALHQVGQLGRRGLAQVAGEVSAVARSSGSCRGRRSKNGVSDTGRPPSRRTRYAALLSMSSWLAPATPARTARGSA